MTQMTVDVNWEIQAPRETFDNGEKRFDQYTASDQPFGPEPESPPTGAPETNGQKL